MTVDDTVRWLEGKQAAMEESIARLVAVNPTTLPGVTAPATAGVCLGLGQKGRLSPWGCSSSPTPDPAFRRSSPVSGLGIGDRRWASYAPDLPWKTGDETVTRWIELAVDVADA